MPSGTPACRYVTIHHITRPNRYCTAPNQTVLCRHKATLIAPLFYDRTEQNLTSRCRYAALLYPLIFTRHDVTIPHLTTTVQFRTKPHTTLPFAICKHNQTSSHIAKLCLTITSLNTDTACLADTKHHGAQQCLSDTWPHGATPLLCHDNITSICIIIYIWKKKKDNKKIATPQSFKLSFSVV